MKRMTILLAAVLISSSAMAETASLLLDIQPSQAFNSIDGGVVRRLLPTGGGHLYLVKDSTSGEEIWVSDGTAAGTHPLRDICPGPCSSRVQTLETVGNVALFFAEPNFPEAPRLWRSDGTRAGTIPIAGNE